MAKHRHPNKKSSEDWMNSKWRPAMGWLYMAVCAFDFILFPILWSLLQSASHGTINSQWQPLTLQGAGLFHIAMGAVLGITAYGRSREKMAGAELGGLYENFGTNAGTTYIPPGQEQVNVSNQPPSNSGYNSFSSPNMNNNVFNNSPMSENSNNFASPPYYNSPSSPSPYGSRLFGPPQTFPEK
jgi:hypothetical protein